MLDRTIPFFNIILRCDAITPQEIRLPDGYTFAPYRDGFDCAWAELEHAIGDFDTVEEAREYFAAAYLTNRSELLRRGVFVTDASGTVVGSCIAWTDLRGSATVSSLHWLVVSPEHRGKGLGRALTQETLRRFESTPVYIHTQPWSWKAILLYITLGFRLQKADTFAHYTNEYEQAMATLRTVVTPEQYRHMLSHTDE